MRAFGEVSENKKSEASLHSFLLRRERDSNPRYSKEYNGFRDRPIRPLWHLSLRGGERGIRTPGTLASSTVFKTAAFDHSAISPSGAKVLQIKFLANLFSLFFNTAQYNYYQHIKLKFRTTLNFQAPDMQTKIVILQSFFRKIEIEILSFDNNAIYLRRLCQQAVTYWSHRQ